MPGRLENEIIIDKKIEERLQNMPQYVSEWHMNLKASLKTASSRRDLVSKVNRYLESIDTNVKDIPASMITEYTVVNYFISVSTKQNNDGSISPTSDSYRQGVYCALKNFLGFMKRKGYISENYMENIEKPKNHDLERINENRIRLTKEDFKAVIDQVQMENSFSLRTRDEAMLRIFMGTGMRKTALKIINVSDVDLENKTLVTIDKGKGGKLQVYPLNDETAKAIARWLRHRRCADTDALFISNRGQRISDKGVSKVVDKYFTKAIGKHVSPHKIRAGVASILYEETNDIEFVRRSIGHSKVETTQRYITTDNTERQQAATILTF